MAAFSAVKERGLAHWEKPKHKQKLIIKRKEMNMVPLIGKWLTPGTDEWDEEVEFRFQLGLFCEELWEYSTPKGEKHKAAAMWPCCEAPHPTVDDGHCGRYKQQGFAYCCNTCCDTNGKDHTAACDSRSAHYAVDRIEYTDPDDPDPRA